MSCLFSFSRYQIKCVIEFLFRQLMMSWTLRFILDHHLKQCPTGRKWGKDRNTKNSISQRKELFRWNKKYFIVFEGLSFAEKIKIWWKQWTQALSIKNKQIRKHFLYMKNCFLCLWFLLHLHLLNKKKSCLKGILWRNIEHFLKKPI